MVAPMGMTRPRPPFPRRMVTRPRVEVDVGDLEGDGLADADAGLEHQADDRLVATLDLGAGGSFDQILERFELYLNAKAGTERIQRGLGYNNLLFMAAELLLLQSHPDQVPFLLIEEPEAHLHPQHQTLFMEVLAARAAKPDPDKGETHQQVQVLLTTHSPQLAAGAELETMTMIVGHRAFPLGATHTRLEVDDYEFLRRFLDATKANLFFARALIVVEGDGEHLLLPAIAEKLDRPLSRHGVSIVNVGHRGLFRYSRILQRKAGNAIPVPVALIPDRDIPPPEAKDLVGDRKTENELTQDEIAARLKTLRRDVGDPVDAFIADSWTLEFDLALRPELAESVHQAVQLAKTSSRKPEWLAKIVKKASETYAGWKEAGHSATEIAVKIYQPVHDKEASKAEVAEHVAPQHHPGPAAGRRVVHVAVAAEPVLADLPRLQAPRPAGERVARQRMTERAGEHLRIEGQDGGPPGRRVWDDGLAHAA